MLKYQSMMIDEYELSKELDYLFSSYLFCNKPQMRRLLAYLVEHYSDKGEGAFDQRAIAFECLGRRSDFDPAENPVVRIEVGRLRRLLNSFYKEEPQRPLSITIPLGQYRPNISVKTLDRERGYLPELAMSPARPERLSLLLQFVTNGEENSALYLLRHQVRIGLTIQLGSISAVRLVVALPNEQGQVADSIDFIMRVVVSATGEGFQLGSQIHFAGKEAELVTDTCYLPEDYPTSLVNALLQRWVSHFFDPEIGTIWPQWLSLRQSYLHGDTSLAQALVHYHQYQQSESREMLGVALSRVQCAAKRYPGDHLVNFALADLYYRDVIYGYQLEKDSLTKGLEQVREALRFNPGCCKLHTLLALLTFFSKEYDIARMELGVVKDIKVSSYSDLFHQLVLQCLMGEWQEGFTRMQALVVQFKHYPHLYPVIAYIHAWLMHDHDATLKWRELLRHHQTESAVKQCVQFMRLPESTNYSETEKVSLLHRISDHLIHP